MAETVKSDTAREILEKVVRAWNNGAGFALVEACLEAKRFIEEPVKTIDKP